MKQPMRLMVIIAIALCFAVSALAGQEMNKSNIKLFAGEVKEISVKEKSIFLKNDNAEMTIVCNDKTVLRSGMSKVITFDDIKKGYIAAALYDVVDGKNVAKSITFHLLKAPSAIEEKAKP